MHESKLLGLVIFWLLWSYHGWRQGLGVPGPFSACCLCRLFYHTCDLAADHPWFEYLGNREARWGQDTTQNESQIVQAGTSDVDIFGCHRQGPIPVCPMNPEPLSSTKPHKRKALLNVVEANWRPTEFRSNKSDLLVQRLLISAKRKHCLVTIRGCSWQRASSMWQHLRQDTTSDVAVGLNSLGIQHDIWIQIQHDSDAKEFAFAVDQNAFCTIWKLFIRLQSEKGISSRTSNKLAKTARNWLVKGFGVMSSTWADQS